MQQNLKLKLPKGTREILILGSEGSEFCHM